MVINNAPLVSNSAIQLLADLQVTKQSIFQIEQQILLLRKQRSRLVDEWMKVKNEREKVE